MVSMAVAKRGWERTLGKTAVSAYFLYNNFLLVPINSKWYIEVAD